MPITALPTPPSRLDPANFSTRADAFLGALPQFVTEANTLEQSLQKYATTSVSTTSTVIGTGAKTLTAETGKAWVVGTTLIIASSANPANYMAGQVTSYNSSTGLLQINVTQSGGSGTFAAWVISISAPSMTVANLSGGSMGSIPYQSGVNTTSMLPPGSLGQVLVSQGSSSAPAFSNTITSLNLTTAIPAGDNSTKVATTQFVGTASPAGMVSFFAMSTAPTGWLVCNGQAVSRTTYSNLFAAIGTTFGAGDGVNTFNLPDLRGEFIRGWDDARGIDAGRTFGSYQADELKSHSHTISQGNSFANGPYVQPTSNGPLGTTNTGATGGSETRPRNRALLACIKY